MNGKCPVFLAASLAVVLAAAPASAGEPTIRPAPKLTDAERAELVAAMITEVAAAEDPQSAASAYARGNSVQPDNIKLHEAYMTRMLKFGLVRIAVHPARALLRLDREHPMALSVTGYVYAGDGKLAEAFDATVGAAVNMRQDASVMHNLGQLAVWYDLEPDLPALSPAARRTFEKLRPEFAESREYAQAYEKMADAYEKRAAALAECDRQMAPLEGAAAEARSQLADAEFEYRALMDEIDSRTRLIESLRRQLYLLDWRRHDGHGGDYYQRELRRQELVQRIRLEELELDRVRQQANRILTDVSAIRAQFYENEVRLANLREQRELAVTRVRRLFRWDPPAVDGVVTPEVERFVYPPGGRPAAPEDPEDAAARRLEVAKLYVRYNLTEKAVTVLREIAAEYPETAAGKEAAEILEEIEPEKQAGRQQGKPRL